MGEKLYSRYLLEEHPITFHTTLAYALGLNEAIVLQKINLWLNCKPHNAEGRNWIYNSYRSWHEQLPFFSESTIKRTLNNLFNQGIILKSNFNKNKMDNTNWYSINYEKLDEIVDIKRKELESYCTDDLFSLNQPDIQSEQTNTNVYYNDIKIDNISNDILSKKNDDSSNRTDVFLEQKNKKTNPNLLVDIYNNNCTNLPKVLKITDDRKRYIIKFLKTYTLEDFEKICKIANQSDFLIGKNNNGWKANFDFLLRIDKATSILEGKYGSTKIINKEYQKEQEQYKAYMGLENLTKEEYRQLENGEITVQELVEKGKLYYV